MPQLGQTVRRAYEVERIPKHTITERVAQFDKKTKAYLGFKDEQRTVENGFFVTFARGHSIFVENEDNLRRLHLDADGGLIDMATGMPVVPNAELPSLRDRAHRMSDTGMGREERGVEGNIANLE